MGPVVAEAIEQRSVKSLIPYAKNARTHSPAQVTQIVASIVEFGFTNPILIDSEGVIIAGHGRVMAAKEMELATVPCIVLSMPRIAWLAADCARFKARAACVTCFRSATAANIRSCSRVIMGLRSGGRLAGRPWGIPAAGSTPEFDLRLRLYEAKTSIGLIAP